MVKKALKSGKDIEIRERTFRVGTVIPALKKLPNTYFEPIQQKSICGSADFFLCCGGTFVALELKAMDGVLSKLQEYKLNKIKTAGGEAFVANPKNWLEIYAALKKLACLKRKIC